MKSQKLNLIIKHGAKREPACKLPIDLRAGMLRRQHIQYATRHQASLTWSNTDCFSASGRGSWMSSITRSTSLCLPMPKKTSDVSMLPLTVCAAELKLPDTQLVPQQLTRSGCAKRMRAGLQHSLGAQTREYQRASEATVRFSRQLRNNESPNQDRQHDWAQV